MSDLHNYSFDLELAAENKRVRRLLRMYNVTTEKDSEKKANANFHRVVWSEVGFV